MRLPFGARPVATGPEMHPGRIYIFGPFELSERDAELRKNGVRIKLQEQPCRVLLELTANPGRIITREELQQKLWPADTFVDFDVGLNNAVRKLRQALADNADKPSYIETIARRGYRFVAPVKEKEWQPMRASAESPSPAPRPAVHAAVAPPEPLTPPSRFAQRRKLYLATTLTVVLVGTLTFVALRHGLPVTPPLATEQRLTSNPEEAPIIGALISPDGKYVAYADSTGVYFRQIANGETHALPLPKGTDWVPTSWYPDSTHLLLSSWNAAFFGPEAFAPESNPSIWKLSILGGTPQKLVEAANDGTVSPDGSRIAYLRGRAVFEPRQIWIANNDRDEPRQVLASNAPHTIVSQIAWSPHGDRIAYIRTYQPEASSTDAWALETLDIRTHIAKVLKVSTRFAPALCWGPDGRLFYGHKGLNAGERDIFGVFALSVDEKTGQAQGQERQLTEGRGAIRGISISADGKRLALWRANATSETFISEIDPQTQQIHPLRRLTLDQNTNMVTTWTPDSRSIVFSSNRSGLFKLYRQAIDQSIPELLVDGRAIDQIRLSPDGTHFIFLVGGDIVVGSDSEQALTSMTVMQVPIEGGSPRLLFRLPSIADIQCARSPANLCLLDTGNSSEVFSFDPDTGNPQNYSLPPIRDPLEWSLAPDGSTLAIILKGPKLVFVDLAGKTIHEVKLDEWKQLIAVDWAADSKSVYIPSRKPNGDYVLLRVQPDGAHRVVLEGGKTPRFQWAIPAPDGRHIAVQAGTGENNVWMIDHF